MFNIDYPTFDIMIPTTKMSVTFRPFTVREEKILLIAQQAGTVADLTRAVTQIINNCVIQTNKSLDFDASKLTNVDIEYIFLKIRAQSVNNIVNLTFRDKEDDQSYKFTIDLNDINVEYPPYVSNTIKVDSTYSIQLQYPSILAANSTADNIADMTINVIKQCISKIYADNEVHVFNQMSDDEQNSFVLSLPSKTYQYINTFLQSMPQIKHEIKYKNSLGNDRVITLNSLSDFFIWG